MPVQRWAGWRPGMQHTLVVEPFHGQHSNVATQWTKSLPLRKLREYLNNPRALQCGQDCLTKWPGASSAKGN